MNRPARLLRSYFALALVANFCSFARAEFIPGYPDNIDVHDARDMALLPKYCKYTQTYRDNVPGGNDRAKIDHYYATLGPGFHAMHHYCNGLIDTNRAMLLATSERIRKFYLETSIQEFDYVIRNSPGDFVMLPEIYTKKGENLLRLGHARVAIETLQRAIEAKPNYWPPYAIMSDHYKKTGDTAKARDWLEKGLAVDPEAKALKRRLADLNSVKENPSQ